MQAQDIVDEARTWLGTAFHHQGRVKKTVHMNGGCDCLGLIVGVCEALDIVSPLCAGKALASFDKQNYSRRPDGEKLKQVLCDVLPLRAIEAVRPSDIVLFKIRDLPQHVGIVSDYDEVGQHGIIHAYAPAGKVVEHRLDEQWRAQIVACFALVSDEGEEI